MMRIVDGLLAMPFLIVVILFRELIEGRVEIIGKFLVNEWSWDQDFVRRFSNIIPLLLAIAAFGWLTMSRIVRTQTAALRNTEFVEAARACGVDHKAVIRRHIVPNLLGVVMVYVTLTIPQVILVESFLSFLGLGVQEPMSSWGALVNDGAQDMESAPWTLIFPAAFLTVTLYCFNYIGDGMRDALDPKDRL